MLRNLFWQAQADYSWHVTKQTCHSLKDRSTNPVILKKDLKNVCSCLKTLILDVEDSWVHSWNWIIKNAEMSGKIFAKYDYLQYWKLLSNTTLFESGLVISDMRQSSLPKMNFKEDFLNIYHLTLPLFQAHFKRWINNNLKVILVIYTPYFLSYSIVLIYETLWDHGGSNPQEILRKSRMPKHNDDSCFQEKQEQLV